jgi:hypothetical protein
MATYPTKDDAEREEKLRQNTSFDTDSKSEDEVDSMHPDSWAGGSVVPDAKKVARGEAPANRGERGDRLPPPADYEDDPDVTRPWSQQHQDEPGAETDAAGRDKDNPNPHGDETGRQAPPTHSPQDDEPGGRPKITTW